MSMITTMIIKCLPYPYDITLRVKGEIMKKYCQVVIALLSVFFLCPDSARAALMQDLSQAYVYPSPYEAAAGHVCVTFENLTSSASLRVFKITGELVYSESFDSPAGTKTWNVVNNDGQPLGPGLYVYVLTNTDGQRTVGKISVIR